MRCWRRQAGTSAMCPLPTSMPRAASPSANSRCPVTASPTISVYVDGKAAGVIEAKKEGVTLTGVETQSDKYTKGLPAGLPRWSNPLPFSYQSEVIAAEIVEDLEAALERFREILADMGPEVAIEN